VSSVFDASRYHTDKRPYKVTGGTISSAGLRLVEDYLNFMNDCTIDLRQTVKSYGVWIGMHKADIDAAQSTTAITNIVDRVRGSSRFYSGLWLMPASGHCLGQYKENAKAYLNKLVSFFADVLEFRSTVKGMPYLQSIEQYIGSDWLVTGKGDYVGTFPKRVAKWLFKRHGVKLSASHLQTIGNLVSDHVSKDSADIYLAFDQEYTEGSEARDYCHHDSCWWGEGRKGLREGFVKEGGWAIRQFDGYTPTSRCWIVWDKEHSCYVLFNAYGKTDLANFSRNLSTAWGLSYSQASLYPDRDEYFINSDKCYVIADPVTAEKLAGTELYVSWHKPIKPLIQCHCCCEHFPEDEADTARSADGIVQVCPDCLPSHTHTCNRCYNRFVDDAMSSTRQGYCIACSDYVNPCRCCNSQLTEQTYCESCVRVYNLIDVYEIDWESMTYRFIPAQIPPHVLNSGGSVSTAPQTTVVG